MKKLFIFLMIFLTIPTVLADITIITDQNVYNIGNKIKASASAMQSHDFEGLFKLTISCSDYKLQYFTTPISLESNLRTAVDVPELTAAASMLEDCALTGQLTTNDGLILEEKPSNPFEITNQLVVLPVKSTITALPHETIKIAGVVNEAHGNNVLKAKVKASLDNNSYSAEAVDGKFDFEIELPKSIKSQSHIIEITASDAKNNIGFGLIELQVTAVPSYLKTAVSEESVLPGSKLAITPLLYDQADDLINVSLELELLSPSQKKVFTKSVQSNDHLEYEFSQYAEPGQYALTTTYKNLKTQALINVTQIREVKVKYEDQNIFVENTGNTPFIDELTFIIQGQLRKYIITKKIEIEPGKIFSIDLSKEIPFGVYSILAPAKEGIPDGQEFLAQNTEIQDNRPVYKKLASGFGAISGKLVGADGLLTKNPLVAPAILIILVLLIAIRYGRKPLMNLIKRKKKEEPKKEENN